MTTGRSTVQSGEAGVVPLRDDAGDLRTPAGTTASGAGTPVARTSVAGTPSFAMLGDPTAAACEGDSCAIP